MQKKRNKKNEGFALDNRVMNNKPESVSAVFVSKHFVLFAVLTFFTIGIFIASLLIGSVDISAKQLLHALWVQDDSLVSNVVLELRLPRTVVGFMVGAMLALAGALMQVLLRNPLAEPYILGISGGASVAVLITMLLGLTGIWISGSAFIGAIISMLLVFGLAHGKGDQRVRCAVDDQQGQAQLLDGSQGIEAGAHQAAYARNGIDMPGHLRGGGECRFEDQPRRGPAVRCDSTTATSVAVHYMCC